MDDPFQAIQELPELTATTFSTPAAGKRARPFTVRQATTDGLEIETSRGGTVPLRAEVFYTALKAIGDLGAAEEDGLDLPPFGAADTPMHTHVAPHYLAKSIEETLVPNVVTSVLASYRGYDTLGETTVIFAAGVGVLLLLKGRRNVKPGPKRKRIER